MSLFCCSVYLKLAICFATLGVIYNANVKNSTNESFAVEFEILEYINSDGRLLNGNCCSGYKSSGGGLCRGGNASCRPYWRICITQLSSNYSVPIIMPTERKEDQLLKPKTTKKPSLIRNVLNRIFGSSTNKTKDGNNDNNVHHKQFDPLNTSSASCSVAYWTANTIANASMPILLRTIIADKHFYDKSREKRLLVLVEVWHKQKSPASDKLIARYIETKNVTIDAVNDKVITNQWNYGGKPKKQNATNSVINNNHSVQYQYRWRILSANDTSVNGTHMCPKGWKGENCEQIVCSQGCDPIHGYCEQPDTCVCKFGWTGMQCNYCLTMPGCIHGNCVKPLECRCEEGWLGMFCSTPKCKDGCHPVNGYCTVPGECKCRFGWEGENCSECSTLPGCQHGSCKEPLDCLCDNGWDGVFCSTPMCSSGCDLRNGWCRRPHECRCRIGYTGSNCTECVPYPGCQNGSCANDTPWTCDCNPGWGGVTCAEQMDWCAINPNPCENDGTCISVEIADGSYLCQCVLGYTGRHCEKLKN